MTGSELDSWFSSYVQKTNINDDKDAKICSLKKERDELRAALRDYGEHWPGCEAGMLEVGEPTPDGYRQRFAGKWYYNGEAPECSCGLARLLK